ncbi:MAG: hypothetical protein WAQ41_00575 [bacterium]|jgi:hypothetical protein|nr:hypothetical protein [Bacillota bacterium]
MKNKYRYDCSKCPRRCDGVSKGRYNFEEDARLSEFYERALIRRIKEEGFFAQKSLKEGYPDIEVYRSENSDIHCYVEVKVQRRTFMKIRGMLPQSDLIPSDTVALNLSDLVRYFKIAGDEAGVPIYVLWVLLERPCILKGKKARCFYQNIQKLKSIYSKYKDKRRFRRKKGRGDVVDGQHKGVVVNYHFSINELKEFRINKIIK